VDDNPINRAVGLKVSGCDRCYPFCCDLTVVLRQVLKKFGYLYVHTATNGLEAVQAAETTKYDLILMDLQASRGATFYFPPHHTSTSLLTTKLSSSIQMPIMDGHTAMSKISASEKAGQPQIVALTANADTVSPSSVH
jgi:CheY-like chemotaxis protein